MGSNETGNSKLSQKNMEINIKILNKNTKIILMKDENFSDAYNALTEKWKPEIIFSCIESKNKALRISEKQKISFKQSLLKIVEEKNAWIFTDGLDKGVTRLIGEVSADLLEKENKKTNLNVIGIGCWEYENNKLLIRSAGKNEFERIKIEESKFDESMLNPYHSAFVCYRGNNSEEDFRVNFENYVTSESKPIFCQILVGGDEKTIELGEKILERNFFFFDIDKRVDKAEDPNNPQSNNNFNKKNTGIPIYNASEISKHDETINTGEEACSSQPTVVTSTENFSSKEDIANFDRQIKQQSSVTDNNIQFSIILKGSKDAADDICDIIESSNQILNEMISKKLEKYISNEEAKNKKMVEYFEKYRKFAGSRVFVHNIYCEKRTLDSTILKCILEALEKKDKEKAFQWAIHFDSKEFINLEVFKNKKPDDKINCIVDAIEFERKCFIDFLFQEVNQDLYINEDLVKQLCERASQRNTKIKYVEFRKRICRLSKGIVKTVFKINLDESKIEENDCGCFQGNKINDSSNLPLKKNSKKKDYITHLFYWALFTEKYGIAKILWKNCEYLMRTALIASIICRSMKTKAKKTSDNENVNDLRREQHIFESMAISILQKAYKKNKEKTDNLLTIKFSKDEPDSCLEIARKNYLIRFLSQSACQKISSKIWYENIPFSVSNRKIIFNIPFGWFLSQWLIFSKNMDEDTDIDDKQSNGTSNSKKKITFCKAVAYFYKAPVVKFAMNVVTYFLFLIVYSYMMIIELNTVTYSPTLGNRKMEYIVYIFVISFFMEEFRQFYTEYNNWKGSYWNWFDFFIYLVFIIAFILRLTIKDDDFVYCRSMFAIALSMFYVRFMQFYSVAVIIGPKLVMITKMINDLLFIIAIYTVSLLAYGTLSVSLITPNLNITSQQIFNIVVLPYWQLYGAIDMEYMKGQCSNCTPNSVVTTANALFLLFANILLLNLLIAIFGKTVDRVQAKSYDIWAYINYEMVIEFSKRPILPPPLNVFEILWRVYQHCRCCRGDEYKDNDTKWLSKNKELTLLEKSCMEMVLVDDPMFEDFKIQDKRSSINDFVDDLNENSHILSKMVKEKLTEILLEKKGREEKSTMIE